MGLLKGDTSEIIGNRRKVETAPSPGRLNLKADQRLTQVCQMFEMAIGERLVETKHPLLRRELVCSDFRYLQRLVLSYEKYVKRIWARAWEYFITGSAEVNNREDRETDDCRFKAIMKGKMSITDAEWVDDGSQCSEERKQRYLQMLNNKMIIDRMVALDMTDVKLVYNESSGFWTLKYRSTIGSTNWIMIPPITHLIKYTPVEVVRTIEFFELVFDAVINRRQS